MATINELFDLIMNVNPQMKNRFENYQDPFSYDDQSKFMDEIYGGYEDQINRSANELTANQQQGAASRMASRGITGGSIVDDTLSGIGTNIGKSKFNALSNLKSNKAKGLLGLQDIANQRKLQTTQGAQNVDSQNFANQLQKLGLLSNIDFKNREMGLAEDQAPGFLEDFFSSIGELASLAGIPTGKDSFLGKDIWESIFG